MTQPCPSIKTIQEAIVTVKNFRKTIQHRIDTTHDAERHAYHLNEMATADAALVTLEAMLGSAMEESKS